MVRLLLKSHYRQSLAHLPPFRASHVRAVYIPVIPESEAFCAIATEMHEPRNKLPAASGYLLENLHFLLFFSYRLDKLIETDKRHHETRI